MICSSCEVRLAGWLRDVPWLLDELDVTITRQDQVTERQPGKSNEKPMMFNERASQAKYRLLNVLRYSANLLGLPTTGHLERDLVTRMHVIRMHDAAAAIYRAIDEGVRKAKQAIDRPAEKVFAGPCNTEVRGLGATALCSADLYARVGKAEVTCRECGAVHDVKARREWMLSEVRHYDADAALMAGILTSFGLQIDSSTIRKYAADGLIEVQSRTASGTAKYRIGDVIDTVIVKKTTRKGAKKVAETIDK